MDVSVSELASARSIACVAVLLLTAPAGAQDPADGAEPGVHVVERTITTAKKKPAHLIGGRWIGERLGRLHDGIEAACYQPALAKKPTIAGELVVSARLAPTGRLTYVTVTRKRGGTLPLAVATCVKKQLAALRVDMGALPPVVHDPDLPGAIYDPPGDPPPRRDLPLTIKLRLALVAPPPPPAPGSEPPAPVCGPNPEGCRRSGCPDGMRCDTKARCVPSSCGCDPTTGVYICTDDCGGGTCVPDR